MFTPEFVAAEIAYRTQRLTEDFRPTRARRPRRPRLHLPAVTPSRRLRARTLASG
jgi:hypothetical protein